MLGFLLIGSAVLSVMLPSCEDNTPTEPENKVPVCEIIIPNEGDTIQLGETVIISVEANDTDGSIIEVRFYINEIGMSSTSVFPFKYEWITENEESGSYNIKTIAKDSDGSSTTAEITVLLINYLEGETLVDYDGNSYKTIKIGNQTWMAKNLRVIHDVKGTPLTNVVNDEDWYGLNNYDKAYCYYMNSTTNASKYGALYTYTSAIDACPEGWHLPTSNEWSELITFVASYGHYDEEGTVLKSKELWDDGGEGTNDYGFSAIPGGQRNNNNGSFYGVTFSGNWWSASPTQGTSTEYDTYNMRASSSKVDKNTWVEGRFGLSVRCIKD